MRWIISDGDDVTFICNARLALQLARAYLESVENYVSRIDQGIRYSSCAGIAIFHSHYPYSRAYEIAEGACDHAKQIVHASSEHENEGYIDFHFIHSGVGGDLKAIRSMSGADRLIFRPWQVTTKEEWTERDIRRLDKLFRMLDSQHYDVKRSNLKSLGTACETSDTEYRLELERICSRSDQRSQKKDEEELKDRAGLKKELENLFPAGKEGKDRLKAAVYDLTEIMDIWDNMKEETENGNTEDNAAV